MPRRPTRLCKAAGPAVVLLAACLLTHSSAAGPAGPVTVDEETKQQLTAAARTMLERRTEALVQHAKHETNAVVNRKSGEMKVGLPLPRDLCKSAGHQHLRHC